MATSMDVDGMPLDQPATLRELPQAQEPSIIHTGLPLSNGIRCFPISAPNIANPSEKSLSRYTFGGPTETPGYTRGVPQFHWTQQDMVPKSFAVVRSTSTDKILTVFSENSEVQAEKRGNFVVVGCIDGPKVVSWSLNALNTSETLRLLACIELACYRCKQAVADPRSHQRSRRRIERVIKDDRRKRHRRRQEQETMIDLFSKQDLNAPEDGL